MQTVEIEVPAKGKVVHLRLHLPQWRNHSGRGQWYSWRESGLPDL